MRKHRKLKITLIVVLLPFMLYFVYFLFFANGFVALAHYNKFKHDGDNNTYNGREYDYAQEFSCYYLTDSRKLKIVSFYYSFPYCIYYFGDEYKNPNFIIWRYYDVYFRKDLDYKNIKLELFYSIKESGKMTGDELKVGNYSINDITGKETKLKYDYNAECYHFYACFDTSYNDVLSIHSNIAIFKGDAYYMVYLNSNSRIVYEVSNEFASLLDSIL